MNYLVLHGAFIPTQTQPEVDYGDDILPSS